ncbi:calcium homeostasis modulator protein 6 isoform X2 [Varanus komodoensis]|uniref:calcium homeostasis modulator protein 6 isoform X2 n=1 Tax=Varanus komodoensis TaxID=61221 RepID=UPI001CF77364|nr:calcium homeostasis modulator protein 6 isoform X2 [Varanus komodoensis]
MEKLRAMLDLCVAHQKVLGYGTVSLLTLGSERIFSDVVFKCPCNSWNLPYGAVFLLVPALILFLLGLLLSSRSWKVLTGCCAPSRPCRCAHGGRLWRHFKVLGLSMAGAAVAPLTWIAVALLRGSFYECAATGTAVLQRYACSSEVETCTEAVLQAPCQSPDSSQKVIGWILIASVFTLVLITTCISHCRSPISILQLAFWKIYTEQEQRLFEAKAKEHAAQLAEKNINYFFGCAEWESLSTPSPKAWHNISSLFAFNPEEHYYSMIHKYASYKAKNGSIQSTEGDTFPVCLTFVDSATGQNQVI